MSLAWHKGYQKRAVSAERMGWRIFSRQGLGHSEREKRQRGKRSGLCWSERAMAERHTYACFRKTIFRIDSAIEEENQAVARPKPQNPDHPEPKTFQP
ncbi:MAG: hypothetical protein EBS60_04500 [Verrucomicrobia bacterium]|nr:hypothetical protein [Verrucomicrobiota bacterium]